MQPSHITAAPARQRIHLAAAALIAALGVALGTGIARADAPPDTSDWKCAQCPFFQGYSAQVEAGPLYADGANDSYGRYSGINHSATYADVGASGQWRNSAGSYAGYQLDNLGLASRQGSINAGQEGRYDLQLDYDGQPARIYDSTATPFRGAGSGQLTLPANWTAAGATSGMTQLAASLSPVDIEYDRRTVSLLGQLYAGAHWTLYTDLSHEEKKGTGLTSASFLTDAMQLPEPIDSSTNTLEGGASWAGKTASVHVAYTGSWYQDHNDSLSWQNPYLPLFAGQTLGRLALPPSNNLQQGALSGEVQLPLIDATHLSYSASIGRLSQNAAFLPVSTLPTSTLTVGTPPGALAPLPGSLNGDVRLSHYALALGSRPWSRLYLRGSASYDGRDDHTPALAVPYTITDELPGGSFVTPRYGEDRARFDGSADYRLYRWIRIGVAGDYRHTHFSPGQVQTSTDENRGWVHLLLNPWSPLSLDMTAGNGRRKSSAYDTGALPINENPLLRAYNYAPRDENFYSLSASWSISSTLSWVLKGSWSDDAYRLSPLGLQDGRDRRLATTATWAPNEKISLYLDNSYQRVTALQNGSIASAAPVWQLRDAQYFWTAGAGGHWSISTRWDLNLDYIHSGTRGDDLIQAGAPGESFPELRSALDSLWLNATYTWTRALKLRLRYGYQRYDSSDWALDNVSADAVPNLLALGAQPYHHSVHLIALSAQYRFGSSNGASGASGASGATPPAP